MLSSEAEATDVQGLTNDKRPRIDVANLANSEEEHVLLPAEALRNLRRRFRLLAGGYECFERVYIAMIISDGELRTLEAETRTGDENFARHDEDEAKLLQDGALRDPCEMHDLLHRARLSSEADEEAFRTASNDQRDRRLPVRRRERDRASRASELRRSWRFGGQTPDRRRRTERLVTQDLEADHPVLLLRPLPQSDRLLELLLPLLTHRRRVDVVGDGTRVTTNLVEEDGVDERGGVLTGRGRADRSVVRVSFRPESSASDVEARIARNGRTGKAGRLELDKIERDRLRSRHESAALLRGRQRRAHSSSDWESVVTTILTSRLRDDDWVEAHQSEENGRCAGATHDNGQTESSVPLPTL